MSEVIPVLPLNEMGIEDFDVIDCIPTGKEVNIIDDSELAEQPVIEVANSESQITFFVQNSYHLLVIHINAVRRFMKIILQLRDVEGKSFSLELSNKRSTVCIENGNCKTPLEIGDGWQRICLDLDDIMHRAFGVKFSTCTEITVCGSCRLSKLYFQNKEYADAQLPKFLRVLTTALSSNNDAEGR
jgi:hypothetical protein